jgi:hypothetical protein
MLTSTKLDAHLAEMVGQEVIFFMADGTGVRGVLELVGDGFVGLTGAKEERRVIGLSHGPVNDHYMPLHWHVLLSQVTGFGSLGAH